MPKHLFLMLYISIMWKRRRDDSKHITIKFNASRSEVTDELSVGRIATHMHHIFPKGDFPVIADYVENLIALTSGQHMQKAHPNGNTRTISKDYQYTCLICKTESIRKIWSIRSATRYIVLKTLCSSWTLGLQQITSDIYLKMILMECFRKYKLITK